MMQWINQLQSKRNNFTPHNINDFSQSTRYLPGICEDGSVAENKYNLISLPGPSIFKNLMRNSKREGGSTFFDEKSDTGSVTSGESLGTTDCTKCKDAQWAAFKLNSKIEELSKINSDYEQMIKELSNKFTLKIQEAENENEKLEIIQVKDQLISDFKRKLMTYSAEIDWLKEENDNLKKELKDADTKLKCNEEIIKCKEQVVLNLSKPIPDPTVKQPNSSSFFYDTKQTVIDEDELEKLRDMNEAYALQICHFQGEILQLQKLRKADEEQSHKQILNYEDLKARHQKVSINYRIMMREFDKFLGGGMPQDSIDLIGQIEIDTKPYLCDGLLESDTPESSPEMVPRSKLEESESTVESYRAQNKLLEDEIIQINNLRQEELKRYHQASAELAKINNHYMLLLREINKLRTGAQTTVSSDLQEIAAALIDQVKDEDLINVQKVGDDVTLKYDRYGFEITKLSKLAPSGKHDINWEKYILQFGNSMEKSKELKALVRQGVPHRYRSSFWRSCIARSTKHCVGSDMAGFYKSLLSKSDSNIFVKQIELDLLRTLPNNCLFNCAGATGVDKLRNVLLAFSRYNVEIGYCQGLNRIAAFALAVLNLKEEDAFWAVVAISEILPLDYYTQTMVGAQIDQRVLNDMMSDKYPKIMVHFSNLNIDLSLITFNWFLTLYVDNTNTDLVLSFWDSFLYEGDKMLFRFALSIFRVHHDALLATKDGIEIYNFCRQIGESPLSTPENIKRIAFAELNPFPMKKVKEKREFHYKKVIGELNALERMRASYIADKRQSALDIDSE